MNTELKCPFCGQELVYDSGIEQWCCDKCHLSGGYKLWQELIRTRKALDVAIETMRDIKNDPETNDENTELLAYRLDQIKTITEQRS